jgi:membrane protein
MSRADSQHRDNLLLIAATTILILTAQRYFQTSTTPPPTDAAVAPSGRLARERAQPGHGRHSRNPFRIPWAGWKDILWRTYVRTNDDRLLATAAGVVFFGLLAVFPAVTALVSSYGLFADPSTIGANLQTLALMLPEGSFQIVQDQIARVLDKGSAALGGTFLFGLTLAVWSANAGVKAVIDALNVVYEEREKRGLVKLNLLSLAFTTGGIAAVLLMVSAVVAFPLALDHLGLQPASRLIVGLARWPLMFVGLLVALAILYRFGPSRRAARWQWLSVGTLAAALLWIAGSAALSWYLSNFGNYNATYGSLGAAIGLMMWMWMSAIIVLCGAELNSESEHQTAVDTTVGTPKPPGSRGAVMADTMGPSVPAVSKQHWSTESTLVLRSPRLGERKQDHA